jgi:hypothetical protein
LAVFAWRPVAEPVRCRSRNVLVNCSPEVAGMIRDTALALVAELFPIPPASAAQPA